MDDADIMVAWINPDKSFTLSDRTSTGYDIPSPDAVNNLELLASESFVTNAIMVITFVRPFNPVSGGKPFPIGMGDFIWAVGVNSPSSSDPNSGFDYHDERGAFNEALLAWDGVGSGTTSAPVTTSRVGINNLGSAGE